MRSSGELARLWVEAKGFLAST